MAYLYLNRPKALNALNETMQNELSRSALLRKNA